MKTKLISVGLPVWNGALGLRRALNALVAQTYSNIEIIISDNASTDGTALICAEYLKRDSRIRYFRQKTNIGPFENFQFVFREAKGEDYFMWAGDDDWWRSDFISRLKSILDQNPDYGVACSSFKSLDRKPEERIYKFEGYYDLTHLSKWELFRHIAGGVVKNKDPMVVYGFWRKKFLDKFSYRLFLTDCKSPDRTFLAEAALLTKFYTLPDVLWGKGSRESPERWKKGRITRKGDGYAHSFYHYTALLLVRLLTSRNLSGRDKWAVLKYYPRIISDLKSYYLYRDLRYIVRSFWLGREFLMPVLRKIKHSFL